MNHISSLCFHQPRLMWNFKCLKICCRMSLEVYLFLLLQPPLHPVPSPLFSPAFISFSINSCFPCILPCSSVDLPLTLTLRPPVSLCLTKTVNPWRLQPSYRINWYNLSVASHQMPLRPPSGNQCELSVQEKSFKTLYTSKHTLTEDSTWTHHTKIKLTVNELWKKLMLYMSRPYSHSSQKSRLPPNLSFLPSFRPSVLPSFTL